MTHTKHNIIKSVHFDKTDENNQGIIPIITPLRTIQSIELKSCNLTNPNNIRPQNQSDIFTFSYKLPTFSIIVQPDLPNGFNTSLYTFQIAYYFQVMNTSVIPPRVETHNSVLTIYKYDFLYFTDINQFLSSITAKFNMLQTYGNLIYSINNNNVIIFTIQPRPNTLVATISIRRTILSDNLGFTTLVNLSSIVANQPYNISIYNPLLYEQTITAILSNTYTDINSLINDVNNQFTQQGLTYNGTLLIYAINNQDSIQINSNAFNIRLKSDDNNNFCLSFDGTEIFNRGTIFQQNPLQLGYLIGNGFVNLSIYPTDFSYTTSLSHKLNSYNCTIDTIIEALNLDFLQQFNISILNPYPGKVIIQIPNTIHDFKLMNTTLTNKILGFTGDEVIINNVLTASNFPNVIYDSYLNILMNIPVQGYSSNGRASVFKIPLTHQPIPKSNQMINSEITQYTENLGYKQYHKITQLGFILNNLVIQFFDRYGFPVPINNYDILLSFEVEDEF